MRIYELNCLFWWQAALNRNHSQRIYLMVLAVLHLSKKFDLPFWGEMRKNHNIVLWRIIHKRTLFDVSLERIKLKSCAWSQIEAFYFFDIKIWSRNYSHKILHAKTLRDRDESDFNDFFIQLFCIFGLFVHVPFDSVNSGKNAWQWWKSKCQGTTLLTISWF